MVDLSDVDSVREHLAKLCLMPDRRVVAREAGIERQRWSPFSVIHRATRSRFSDEGAWALIADFLNGSDDIEYKPPDSEFDDHAYIMIDTEEGDQDIYIKIALCMKIQKVIGISFHYAEF